MLCRRCLIFVVNVFAMHPQPIRATRPDKTRFVEVLTAAFAEDPHANWLAGTGPGQEKRLRLIMEFAFEQGLVAREAYLSPDNNAVAIWRLGSEPPTSWRFISLYLKFVRTLGWRRIREMGRLEKEIARQYPRDREFLQLWLLGVDPAHQGRGLSSRMLDARLAEAARQQLPVYLETSTRKNVALYRRKGFAVYHEFVLDAATETQIFMMRRTPPGIDRENWSAGASASAR